MTQDPLSGCRESVYDDRDLRDGEATHNATVHFRALVNGTGQLSVAVQSVGLQCTNTMGKLAAILEGLLRFDSSVWTPEEWHETLGLADPPAHWTTHALLLCRAQIAARRVKSEDRDQGKYLMLPGGDVVSTRLFWPRNQPTSDKKPLRKALTRIPENVLLYALHKLLDKEEDEITPSGVGWWSDSVLASKLVEWLTNHGATLWWLHGVPADSMKLPNAATFGRRSCGRSVRNFAAAGSIWELTFPRWPLASRNGNITANISPFE